MASERGEEGRAGAKVHFFDLDGDDAEGKRATKGYSQESVLRIQNVFEEDRGATYGDEGGVPSKLPKKEDITKIKNRWSLFGVLFGLLSKGFFLFLLLLPVLHYKWSLEAMSEEECRKSEECMRHRHRLVVDHTKCPAPHFLVRLGLVPERRSVPNGVWWNFEGTDLCYWISSIGSKAEPVTWHHANKNCKKLHQRAQLITLRNFNASIAVMEHLKMLQRMLTQEARMQQNLTYSHGLDYWVAIRSCKTDKKKYENTKVKSVDGWTLCDKTIKDAENNSESAFGPCTVNPKFPGPDMFKIHPEKIPQNVKNYMKSKGLGKTLHRDLMMEELLAIVSYTEFASWWKAIYNRRERIKSYVKDKGQNEDLEYFRPCKEPEMPNTPNILTQEEEAFMKDSLFQTFCLKLAPALSDLRLYREFHALLQAPGELSEEEKRKFRSVDQDFTIYSVPCDWKLGYICELDCNRTHNDCNVSLEYGELSDRH